MDSEDEPVTAPQASTDIVFSEGLVGLPGLVHNRLSAVPESVLFELHCQDDPTMGFIVASADDVKPGTSDRLRERGLVAEGELVLAILAVHGEPPSITANLAGPLVVNPEAATGRQLVVEDPEFPLQVPVGEAV